MQRDVLDFEKDRAAGRHAGGDQILHHFLLAVDGDGMPGEPLQIDAMAAAVEEDLHPFVLQALHASADQRRRPPSGCRRSGAPARRRERGSRCSGGSSLEHHRIDASQVKQLGEQQAGGAGADNGDLGTHGGEKHRSCAAGAGHARDPGGLGLFHCCGGRCGPPEP